MEICKNTSTMRRCLYCHNRFKKSEYVVRLGATEGYNSRRIQIHVKCIEGFREDLRIFNETVVPKYIPRIVASEL
jgi:hypothetical protein